MGGISGNCQYEPSRAFFVPLEALLIPLLIQKILPEKRLWVAKQGGEVKTKVAYGVGPCGFWLHALKEQGGVILKLNSKKFFV